MGRRYMWRIIIILTIPVRVCNYPNINIHKNKLISRLPAQVHIVEQTVGIVINSSLIKVRD